MCEGSCQDASHRESEVCRLAYAYRLVLLATTLTGLVHVAVIKSSDFAVNVQVI